MERSEQDEIEWLAFRYVAGEMNATEAQEFESRLESNEAARDAVCRAVALTERLAAAGPAVVVDGDANRQSAVALPPATAKSRRLAALRALGWMSLGAAAALAMLVLARPGIFQRPLAGNSTTGNRHQPVANAIVWARLQTTSQWADEQDERYLDEAEIVVPADGADFEPAYPVPTWLHRNQSKKRGMP